MASLILSCISIICALISVFFSIKTLCLKNKTYPDIAEIYKEMEKKTIDKYNENAELRNEAVCEYMGMGSQIPYKENKKSKKKKNEVKRNDSI